MRAHVLGRAGLVIAVVLFVSLNIGGVAPGTEETPANRTVVGILEYVPPPDVTICFCGSFFVKTEKEEVVYLASDTIDLFEHLHDKVTVTGTAFVIGCTGTLYRPCDFVRVSSIKLFTTTPNTPATWGAIKSLFD